MNNALLVLDIAMAAMNTAARAQELLLRAQTEGRDVTAEELLRVTQETNALKDKWEAAISTAE